MGGEMQLACFVAALAGACGGHQRVHRVERPTLESLSPNEGQADAIGAHAPPGFLRACETRALSPGLIELSCGEHLLVEFRRVNLEESETELSQLDELMTLLSARFGEMQQRRGQSSIDRTPIRTSAFSRGARAEGVNGLAAVIGNTRGLFWGLACYRKQVPASDEFCRDAIATAARSGGLAHVEARPMREFADGKLVLAEGCESLPGRGISCAAGKLSWSAEGTDAQALHKETLANVRTMAAREGVRLLESESGCELMGKQARCQRLHIQSKDAGDELDFILVTGGDQDRLVICSFPAASALKGLLPEPCAQAIVLTP